METKITKLAVPWWYRYYLVLTYTVVLQTVETPRLLKVGHHRFSSTWYLLTEEEMRIIIVRRSNNSHRNCF
jgi:hypothetical protein